MVLQTVVNKLNVKGQHMEMLRSVGKIHVLIKGLQKKGYCNTVIEHILYQELTSNTK